jgi:hypothetical protein
MVIMSNLYLFIPVEYFKSRLFTAWEDKTGNAEEEYFKPQLK